MQKSQLEAVDPWPVPLIMRSRSGNGRDKKKVSCETLSKVDWYSRRPHEAQLYYHSDDDEDQENPVSEAEDDHELDDAKDDKEGQRDYTEKLARHANGEGFSAQGPLHFLQASSHSKAPQGRSAMALSSPGRDGKKTERVPRTYPSPIPHSGSLLPPSGRLLPHSGPIKLHVGSHANTHTIKVSGSTRGSSLIPSNIVGKSSKSSGFGTANEPSSPKVTCFGRVKIKQKYCREMGRLADMAAAGACSNDKAHKSIGDQMMKLTRRKHKAHAAEEEGAITEEGVQQRPVHKEADMSSRIKARGEDEKKANMASSSSVSAGAMTELQKSRHGWGFHREDPASDSDSKGQRGRWRLKEPGARMKFRGADKKKWQPPDAEHSSAQVDCAIDLNRFCSSQQPDETADRKVSKSLASLSIDDESLEIEQMEDRKFVPPVPPANSLLLMRNSKSRGMCVTIAASSTSRRHGTETYEQAVVAHRLQVPSLSALKETSLKQLPSRRSLSGVDITSESDFAMKANGHEQVASFAESRVKKMFAIAPVECTPLQVKTNHKISLSKTPPERGSLWERRSIMRPSTIDVGKP